jgi:hypothetical protein
MAIDGVKIIDSDSAHDIHTAVVEAWKGGSPLADILAEVRGYEQDFCFNALETEIYWTALTFSLWKIGQLPDDVRDKTLQLIADGACADWLKIDPKAQNKRQKELDALANKIRLPNPKPLARSKLPKLPKISKQPLFAVGDVLAVALPDDQYGACVLVTLEQTPRKIEYHFAIVNLWQPAPPTLDDVGNARISYRASIGFDTSCWTDHKTVSELLPFLKRIGRVQLTVYRMGTYSAGLGTEDFFQCWDRDSVGKKTCLMWNCIQSVITENVA